MVAFPIRILHFIYPAAFGVVYGIFLLILHFVGINSSVYPVLNFADDFPLAIGVLLLSAFVAPVILQCVIYLLHLLRKFCVDESKSV